MSAIFLPGSSIPVGRAPVRRAAQRLPFLPACVLALAVALLATAWLAPSALRQHPAQATVLFKQLTGYAMLALLAFCMVLGALRRRPAFAAHHAAVGRLHQAAGLLLLLLLAAHLGQVPRGFLGGMLVVLLVATAAGALRALLGSRAPARLARVLLVVHVVLSCLVTGAVLVHLYLVYAYTA